MRDYDWHKDGVGQPPNTPSTGWIQWKGTDVCMDIHCQCGATHHFDGDFFYFWACGACGRTYMVDGHIAMRELPPDVKPGQDGVPLLIDDDPTHHNPQTVDVYTTGLGLESVAKPDGIVWPPWWDGPKEMPD